MALVALMWMVGAIFLFIQSVYTARTGRVMFLFTKPEHQHAPRSTLVRSAWACFYLATSVAMIVLLANKIHRFGTGPLNAWLDDNFGMLFWSSVLAVIGILHLVQPAKMLRWTIRSNPRLSDNRSMIITARLIGLGMLGIAFVILARL